MAASFPVSVAVASGATAYMGRFAPLPAWRQAIAANTWGTLPGNTLASIDPALNPAINPNYPGTAPWRGSTGFTAITDAYNGACWDEILCRLILPLQGGHHDYAGNEGYPQNCLQDVPSWSMYRNPSGAVGNVINLYDGQEVSGVYADGRIRSPHSYNNNVFVPGLGPVITRLAGFYDSGQAGADRAYVLNETTGEAALLLDYSSFGSIGSPYGGSAHDPSRNCVWMLGIGTSRLAKLDLTAPPTMTAARSANNFAFGYAKLIYLPEHDLLAVFHNGESGFPKKFFFFDLANNAATILPAETGSFASGFTLNGFSGVGWDGSRFLLWDNASNTTQISTLSPTGNPRTAPWQLGALTVSGANAVTPTGKAPTGTWGRFGYSHKLRGCYLLNAVNQPTYFFAME